MTKLLTRLSTLLGVVLLICVLPIKIQAQQNKELANQLIGIAEEIMKSTRAMDQARENYVQAAKFDSENIKANFFAGEYHLLTVHKERSAEYFIQVKSLDEEYRFDIDYKIGLGYQYGLDFEKAIEHYNRYKSKVTDTPGYEGSDFVALEIVDQKIDQCRNGIELIKKPVEVSIVNLGSSVNSDLDDFGPIFNEDESIIIFTSRRRGGNQNEDVHEDNKPYEDVYFSEKADNTWGPATNLGPNVNSSSHDSNLAMSPNGTELYIYKGDEAGDIYSTKKNKDGLWANPERIDNAIDSEDFAETSLCFSPDGKVVIFSSNRPFGKGSFDLWYSAMQENGSWGTAVNLGDVINTPLDEDGPFLDFDGKTLYFSSMGHVGMGGYDIFKSEYDSAQQVWSKPQNIGYPINTADNDIYYITSRNGKDAYYASVREDGLGYTDIYLITEKIPEAEKVVEPPKPLKPVTFELKVVDASSGAELDAKVVLTNLTNDVATGIKSSGVGTFTYEFENKETTTYRLSVEKPGYVFENTNLVVPASTELKKSMDRTISLKKLVVNTRKVLRNIYFNFDKATFQENSMAELNSLLKMMNENATLRIEISGHTDNIGAADYNKDLSQRRADAIKKFLVDNGVQQNRIESKGFGEEKPLASNDDEREGREINRRVEFKVIE